MAELKVVDLKRCPFCGAYAEIIQNTYFHVECQGCYASTDGYKTEQMAADAWNRRADNG